MRGRGMEGKAPEAILLSVPQMPVAITRTSTSSAPACGSGTSVTSNGSENRLRTAALMAESYQPLGGRRFRRVEYLASIGLCVGKHEGHEDHEDSRRKLEMMNP